MTKNEIEMGIQQTIEKLINEIGYIKLNKIFTQQRIGKFAVDIVADVQVNRESVKLIIEVKSSGEPRQVRLSIQQYKELIASIQRLKECKETLKYEGIIGAIIRTKENQIYGIVAAPYITEDSARICKENGVGYIDLAGNCFLKFGKVFIERKNYPNPFKEKRIVRSIFTPKASRVLRVILSNPKKTWQLQELAKESEVSLGQVYKVKERLLDLEYADKVNKNIVLKRPDVLLSKWPENYSFRKNKLSDYFVFGEPKDIEQKVAEYCKKNNITYALTLFSGAGLVAPYARYTRAFIYIKERIQEIVDSLQLKPVDSGPNVTILQPFDEGVFYGLQEINGIQVVCNVQLYLDLVSYKGRGEEAAKFLLEEKIKPQW